MSGHEKGKITIREALRDRDKEVLYPRIEAIWVNARELHERQRSKEQHQQGALHCEFVEKNLGKIIQDKDKANFTPLELFLLSGAACYHDAGKSDDFNEGHASIAMKDIYLHPDKYNLSDPEGKVLSNIIGSHDIDEVFNETPETYPIGNEDVRVKLLSALFRLADVLHTDNSRIPHIIVGDTKKEDEKTRFRKLIQGWNFNDELKIVLKATPEDLNDINLIAKGVSMMQKQLECVSPILRSNGYPYEIIYSCDNRGIKWKAETENKRNLIEMDFYTENEADIFKGRDLESKGLLKKVIGSNISLLIGNSGVGKTSLIRAGLFPKLSKMGWVCIWTRPVNPAPFDRILNDINANLPVGYESKDIISSIKKLSEHYGTNDIIITIDQFEDILRSPQPVKDELGKILLRIYGKSFRNVHILLSYRGDYEPEINTFLDNSGIISPSRFPLLGLDSIGAHDALRSIFETNNVGISDELIDRIIKELEKELEHGKFHPPFIQIVASSLINLAESNGGVISEELYHNEAKSVETIIGAYLINRLNEFGDIDSKKRINAEAILKELVRDRAKEQKGKDELIRYLNIPEIELQELLDIMVDKRLIRHLGMDNYEIIHDFLASKVEEMIKDEERPLRGARQILQTKAQNYPYMPTPSLLEPHEMVLLYSMKESIKPTPPEKELLMFSYLAGKGAVWWWLKEDKNILQTIIKKALSSIFPNVRAAAVAAYGELGTRDDLSTIVGMLKDHDLKVRVTAIRVFEKLGIHDDLQEIKEMLKDRNWVVRNAAIRSFGELGNHSDLEIIMGLLKDHDRTVRETAAMIFIKLVTRENLPLIKEMIENKHRNLRATAVIALGKLSTHDNLPTIKWTLNDRAKDVRIAAIKVFENLGNHSDLPTITDMFRDIHRDVIAAAITAFGKLGTHADIEIIKKMLKHHVWEIRKAAVSAFMDLATREDLETIKEMFEDTDWDTKRAAVGGFVKLATREDLETIKGMFEDTDWDVRKTLVAAFGKLGNHSDISIIKEMLKDSDSGVREAAVIAFKKLSTHEELSTIKEMLKDSDSEVRLAAATLLEKYGNEKDLQELTTKYANGEIAYEECLKCIISMDEKFYSSIKNCVHGDDDDY